MVEEVQPDRTLAQLVERIPDKDEVTGPSPVRPTMANDAVLKFARQNLAISFYGDMDYYIQHNNNRGKIIQMLIDVIESQDKEIAKLQAQQQKLVEKVLGIADPPPAPTVPAPTVQTVQQGVGANQT